MKPQEIVAKMMEKDAFSQWLGLEVINVEVGHCELRMQVREDMLNGFLIAHGGISYSMADSCLAFAANSVGDQAVSIQTDIKHLKAVKAGDVLIATSKEIHRGRSTGTYVVEVKNGAGQLVAHFNGMVKILNEKWS